MNNTKPRKACINCYQKKVRCNWSEAVPVCSYCLRHDLQCLLPDPSQPVPRIAVRDKLAEFDARLRLLENESMHHRRYSEGSLDPTRHPSTPLPSRSEEDMPSASTDYGLADVLAEPEPTLGFISADRKSSELYVRSQSNPAGAVVEVPGTPGTHLIHTLGDSPMLSTISDTQPNLNTGGSQGQSVRRFRGESSPWNVLVDGTSELSAGISTGPFNETLSRISEEERSTKSTKDLVEYDLLKDFPLLTPQVVREYTRRYGREAPFSIIHWESLEASIEAGMASQRWVRWGEVVCVLLYIAFGSAHLKVSGPSKAYEAYFQRAWSMLPQLLFEQDLWALKGLTLMVHYLQGGSLPEPCYTLLGSASRMAISLGFHRNQYDKTYNSIEEEEGRRCWWLCYILEKTFSLVLGRPSINLEICEAEIPRPFSESKISGSNFSVRGAVSPLNDDPNDEEVVCLFVDLIEALRTRDEILRSMPARGRDGSLQPQFASKHENVGEILDHWRAASKLGRPLDFDTTHKGTLRATICDLCYYNSLINIDRLLKQDFERTVSIESLQAARATIRLVSESGSDEMTMCIWMWLYYGFSAAVVLFLDIIYHPLHPEATLNIALISDLENLCAGFASYSPGAKRVMDVSREMNKLAFELIKAKAKRKAQEDLHASSGVDPRTKQMRTKEPDHGPHADGIEDADQNAHLPTTWQVGHEREEDISWGDFPANFSWDDWDQWLNNT